MVDSPLLQCCFTLSSLFSGGISSAGGTPVVRGSQSRKEAHSPPPRVGKRAPVLSWRLNVDIMTGSQLEAYHRKCEPGGEGGVS